MLKNGPLEKKTIIAMKKILLLIPVIFFYPCLIAEAAPEPDLWPHWLAHNPTSSCQVDHSRWGRFLQRYLDDTHPSGINRVRYVAVTTEDKKHLQEYLDSLQGISVSDLRRLEQKAYGINLYNALTVKVILDHYPVKSIREIDISPGWFSNGPWDAKLVQIEGKKLSLNDIEHRILRPIWEDSRIHYGVNCASLSCPNLLKEPFTAENTYALLEYNANAYINHPRGMSITDDEAVISSIYDWFQEDFGGNEKGVRHHLLKYSDTEHRKYLESDNIRIKYIYNWNLNE